MEVPPQGLRLPPRILYLDIETALMRVDLFSLYVPGKYISWRNIHKRSYVICWSAAWVSSDKPSRVRSDVVTQAEAKRGKDKRCLQGLFAMMDAADYIITHNGNKFDLRKLNTRYLLNGMDAPLTYKPIDTLALAKKHFAADSNALEHWSLLLGGERKDDMRLEHWQRICDNGDPKSLARMVKYCRGDVREGVHVFQEFRRWIESSGKQVYR